MADREHVRAAAMPCCLCEALTSSPRPGRGDADRVERGAASFADVRRGDRRGARNIRHVAGDGCRAVDTRRWGVTIVRVAPLERSGLLRYYGRYPLPSSLLMSHPAASPASPVSRWPRPDPTVMAAALEAGVSRLLRIGGAHAVAALAYGTATIPRVDKIVGPGNAYVAAAKALVATDCAIDFFAGPSEILVISTNGRPAWIAADLIAQAEHDEDARAIFVTPNARLARAVSEEISKQLPDRGPAPAAIAVNGAIVVTRTLDEAVALSERMAPEHVVCDSATVAARLTRAGTVFIGHERAGVRRLPHRIESRVAHERRRTRARRAERSGFRARDDDADVVAVGIEGCRAPARSHSPKQGTPATPRRSGFEECSEGLHLAENTAGFAGRIWSALRVSGAMPRPLPRLRDGAGRCRSPFRYRSITWC